MEICIEVLLEDPQEVVTGPSRLIMSIEVGTATVRLASLVGNAVFALLVSNG
ncbi:hypothetical protein G7085_01385 [Tessaracoccus sp. HDW20]|nr:hypothetical protein [Tessaracoccus coleopterorum]